MADEQNLDNQNPEAPEHSGGRSRDLAARVQSLEGSWPLPGPVTARCG